MDSERKVREMEEERAAKDPLLRAAVGRAEESFQEFLKSPEWQKMVNVASGQGRVHGDLVRLPLITGSRLPGFVNAWIGSSVQISQWEGYLRGHGTLILRTHGTLQPIVTWWETGQACPQRPLGGGVLSLEKRLQAVNVVIGLCDLFARGGAMDLIADACWTDPRERRLQQAVERIARGGEAEGRT